MARIRRTGSVGRSGEIGRSGEKQRASANLEFDRAVSLRDQIMEVKSGTGLTKLESKCKPVKYTHYSGRRRSRV